MPQSVESRFSLTNKEWIGVVLASVILIFGALTLENLWLLGIPAAAFGAWIYFRNYAWFYYIMIFCAPLSLATKIPGTEAKISLPAEGLIVLVFIAFIIQLVLDKKNRMPFFRHPVALLIFLHLIWLLVTSFTSSLPIVSFKFLLVRLLTVTVCFGLGTLIFWDQKQIRLFFFLFLAGLIPVIAYTLIQHSMFGWTQKASHWVCDPFYTDHTSYGAILSMFLFPVYHYFNISRKEHDYGWALFFGSSLLLLLVALFFSFTRAAWLSVFLALFFGFLMRFKWPLYRFLIFGGALLLMVAVSRDSLHKLQKTNQRIAPAERRDQLDHIKSAYNVSTDESNTERINRWMSALRMFGERPVLGFGPGTYMMEYGVYQKTDEKTSISTTSGNLGGAHSEYLGPLSETGLPGLILFLAIILVTFQKGLRLAYYHPDARIRSLATAILLGWLTYLLHGVLNNFLETDKAAIPFWSLVGLIVALDLKHAKEILPLKE